MVIPQCWQTGQYHNKDCDPRCKAFELINPATKYVALSASNRARIKARLAGNGKPLSKAATPIRVLFEAPNK